MMSTFARFAGAVLVVGLLSACSHNADAPAPPSVAVTTVQPTKRPFTDSIAAIGSAISNPRHARHLSLAHGGEVVAVMVSNGQSVHAGEVLLKIAAAPAARKTYKQAQSALALARDELARDKQLATQHLATRAQVDAARKAVGDAEATLQAQRQLGGGQAIDTVTAPAAGVITNVQVTRGQRVPANTALATFTPTSGLIAQLGVQPDQAARLAPGMPVIVHAVYGASAAAQGKVSMVGHAVDPSTHLVPVQVTLPASWAAHVVAGAALSARIQTVSYDAWAVPRSSLRHDAKGDFLFQADHGHARRVDVTVRSPAGDTVGVTGKLDPQLPVIVLGAYELSNGMAVRGHAR